MEWSVGASLIIAYIFYPKVESAVAMRTIGYSSRGGRMFMALGSLLCGTKVKPHPTHYANRACLTFISRYTTFSSYFYLPQSLSVFRLFSVSVSAWYFLSIPVYLYPGLSVCLSLSLSVCVYVSVCLPTATLLLSQCAIYKQYG